MLSDFQENQKIEAQDQYGKWYVARVVQVDEEEKELLIHFEGWNARYDEWISCNSFRLRPLSMENKRKLQEKKLKKFQVGDIVQARWVNGKYYPATVKVIDNLCDKATVLFQDNVEHVVLLKDIRAQKKPDKQSEWAKLQQEAKGREDRHTALARTARAKKRTAELDTSGESPKQASTPSKKPRLESDDAVVKSSPGDSTSPQSNVAVSESGNVSPSTSDATSPGASKRKAFTPLRTQYCLRETVIPIQPLSLEQHGKCESPSKITRRISSTEDSEDPLQSSSSKGSAKSKSQAGGTKKGKQEETGGKKKRRVLKETAGKQHKKTEQEVTPTTSVPTAVPVSLPDPIFLTPPLDSTSTVSGVTSATLSTHSVQPTPPYTPAPERTHVSSAKDHTIQSQSSATLNNVSMDDLSLASDSKDVSSSSSHEKSPPIDSKSISMARFNVDILNTEDDKSASPAVVTIDPNATHSPINNTEPTSSVTVCDPTEERPFVELTKKTAAIISNTSPKRPSLMPFRRRTLSATSSQATATRPVSNRGRRKSEGAGGRSNQARRREPGSVRATHKLSALAEHIVEKDMAPKELVIKMDHNDFKCQYRDCGKSFRKESLLQWHYKHYHPGKDQHFTAVTVPKTKSPVHKSPVHKSATQKLPNNKQPLNPAPPTPPTLLAVAKQQEQAVQSATQAIVGGITKPPAEKPKTKRMLSAVVTTMIPTIPIFTLPGTGVGVTTQNIVTKEFPITTKISVPKEPVISPFLPSLTAASSEVKNGKGVTGVTTSANTEAVKLSSSVTMELLKGGAVRMIAPKPSVVQTGTPTSSTPSVSPGPTTPQSSTGAAFRGFPPVTTVSTNSIHSSWTTKTAHSTPQPSSPGRKGVVIRGHPRGESSRPRGATISHISDDSSVEDLDVGDEYRPSSERHTRASRPFGSSSCSYYCSGNKDDVIHCLCGSFEDEGFMIQCEQCLCWQHADCVGIDEEQPPEHYLCCICQSPYAFLGRRALFCQIALCQALRKNAKFKFDRSWYKDGKLPSLKGGPAFTRSDDVISTHKISGSLSNLNQCLHSLEQLLAVAGQPNHPLLKHWDSGKESAITRKLTQRLTSMLKDREPAGEEEKSNDVSSESVERSARTTPINELHLGGGAGNHAKRPLQLAPLPPVTMTREELYLQNSDDKQSSTSDSSINVTSVGPLQLPPLPPHRRKLFDEESNCSTPGLQNLSSISTPLADEETQMEHSGLDLLTEVAATCSRMSTPSTISQDKSPVGDTPDTVSSNPVPASSPVAASFMDEFGMEEASVFALTPSSVTTPELDNPATLGDHPSSSSSIPPTSETSPDNDVVSQVMEETESPSQSMQSVMEMIERLTADLDTTAQLLPLVTPSQFAEAFMKVDTSCWASRMLLLDHVEAMQEKVLAQMDQLEDQFKGITGVEYSPDISGTKNELMKKMNNWCNLGITSAA